MVELVLYHHALGLTDGVRSLAEEVRDAGHTVHTPDLYDGNTFADLDSGLGYAKQVGFGAILELGKTAAEGLPNDLVYAGISLGAMPAQALAQTRPGARGAVLISAAFPPSEFDGPWPDGVPLQIHMMEGDEFVAEGDLDAAREIAASTRDAELFLYQGEKHLFVDKSLPDHDEGAATDFLEQMVSFLGRV
ncbi:MAG TPA: dienelactone hydrolase family protein [Actinomycetota bacterium]|nr:dienelactone hydrolase family protein [Actinomycetota bacterium]